MLLVGRYSILATWPSPAVARRGPPAAQQASSCQCSARAPAGRSYHNIIPNSRPVPRTGTRHVTCRCRLHPVFISWRTDVLHTCTQLTVHIHPLCCGTWYGILRSVSSLLPGPTPVHAPPPPLPGTSDDRGPGAGHGMAYTPHT